MTAASSEQEAGINQINQAVTEMDIAIQQNAALVENAAGAAALLQHRAVNLAQAASFFRLEGARLVNVTTAGTTQPTAALRHRFAPAPRQNAPPTIVAAALVKIPMTTGADVDWEQL